MPEGDTIYRARANDDPATLRSTIEVVLDGANVLVVAGGVSVGKFDLVPAILEEIGVTVHFRQVRMKPGKPLLFGTKDDKLIFGLPGNPLSTVACFLLLGGLDSNPEAIAESQLRSWVGEGIVEWPGHVDMRPWLAQ